MLPKIKTEAVATEVLAMPSSLWVYKIFGYRVKMLVDDEKALELKETLIRTEIPILATRKVMMAAIRIPPNCLVLTIFDLRASSCSKPSNIVLKTDVTSMNSTQVWLLLL